MADSFNFQLRTNGRRVFVKCAVDFIYDGKRRVPGLRAYNLDDGRSPRGLFTDIERSPSNNYYYARTPGLVFETNRYSSTVDYTRRFIRNKIKPTKKFLINNEKRGRFDSGTARTRWTIFDLKTVNRGKRTTIHGAYNRRRVNVVDNSLGLFSAAAAVVVAEQPPRTTVCVIYRRSLCRRM